MTDKGCCTPARDGHAAEPAKERLADAARRVAAGAVDIPGGSSLLGTNDPQLALDGEQPLRKARVKPFLIGQTTVTNADFAAFIDATGYLTEAERFGWSYVFWAQVPKSYGPTEGVVDVEWWRKVDGATWRAPNGPGTESDCLPDHPVVQVSWNDARAYCAWVGGRLPTEAEWEHAARGGLGDVRFPWGTAEPNDTDHTPCNIWQGSFPRHNTAKDGFLTTAPAKWYAPNGYGLYNLVGNVWEWTADAYRIKSLKKDVKEKLKGTKGHKLLKGGSFLCHASYCYRYRIAARSSSTPDSTTTHQGFRVVWDLTKAT